MGRPRRCPSRVPIRLAGHLLGDYGSLTSEPVILCVVVSSMIVSSPVKRTVPRETIRRRLAIAWWINCNPFSLTSIEADHVGGTGSCVARLRLFLCLVRARIASLEPLRYGSSLDDCKLLINFDLFGGEGGIRTTAAH